MTLNLKKIKAADDLRRLSETLVEIADMIEKEGYECLQCTQLTIDKKTDDLGVLNMEIKINLSVFDEKAKIEGKNRLLKFVGCWKGSDFEECLELLQKSKGKKKNKLM